MELDYHTFPALCANPHRETASRRLVERASALRRAVTTSLLGMPRSKLWAGGCAKLRRAS